MLGHASPVAHLHTYLDVNIGEMMRSESHQREEKELLFTLSVATHANNLPEEEHDSLKKGSEIVISVNGLLGVKQDIAKDLKHANIGE